MYNSIRLNFYSLEYKACICTMVINSTNFDTNPYEILLNALKSVCWLAYKSKLLHSFPITVCLGVCCLDGCVFFCQPCCYGIVFISIIKKLSIKWPNHRGSYHVALDLWHHVISSSSSNSQIIWLQMCTHHSYITSK